MTSSISVQRPPRSGGLLVGLRYRAPARYLVSWVALAGVSLLVGIWQPATFSGPSFEFVTGLAGCLLVASLGVLLVVMQGAIDLSVAGYITLSAAVNIHFLAGMGPVLSFLIASAMCVVISLLSGALITLFRLNALIVTLAVNTIIMAVIPLWMGQSFASDGSAPRWLRSIALTNWLGVNAIFWVALLIAIVSAFVMTTTRMGRRYVATGTNPRASKMLGINGTLLAIGGFGVAGLLYSFAGALLTGLVRVPGRDVGAPYMLMTIVAVALAGALFNGGPASISSLVAASLVLQVLDQALALENLSQGVRSVTQGLILVLAVALGTIVDYGRAGLTRLRELTGGSS